jgi:CBS domain-containing protein
VSVEPGATVRAALRVMEEKDIGFLPVLDGEKLVGVVPERDIASGVILSMDNRIDVIREIVKAIDLHQRARLSPEQPRAHHERRDS